jgi:hypothetical protein
MLAPTCAADAFVPTDALAGELVMVDVDSTGFVSRETGGDASVGLFSFCHNSNTINTVTAMQNHKIERLIFI